MFTKLCLNGARIPKPVESLGGAFSSYTFLRTLELKNNNISDISMLASFPNLINLNLTGNKIQSLKVFSKEPSEGEEGEEVVYWPML